MELRPFVYFLIALASVLLVLSIVGLISYFRGFGGPTIVPSSGGGFTPLQLRSNPNTPATQPINLAATSISFSAKDANTLLISWNNLPGGTNYLALFRSHKGAGDWLNWKTVAVVSADGSLEIPLFKGENVTNYSFYGQAIGNGAEVLWVSPVPGTTPPPTPPGSPPGESSTTPPPPVPAGSPASPPANPTPPPPTPPGPLPPTPPPASSSTTPVPPTPPPTPPSSSSSGNGSGGSTSTPVYSYYPSGAAIPGNETADFWVLPVNQNIEVGWQHLPLNTTRVIVYRSATSTGPWQELLRQDAPTDPYYIRIIDTTLNDPYPYYYEMKAYQNSQVLATYGPVELTP